MVQTEGTPSTDHDAAPKFIMPCHIWASKRDWPIKRAVECSAGVEVEGVGVGEKGGSGGLDHSGG